MNILIEYRHREDDILALPIDGLARFVLAHENIPDACEVSISFVDDEEIAALNEEFRGISGPTDVLSFECDSPMEPVEGDAFPSVDSPYAQLLGDVIIAVDVAERQTSEFGTTFEEEVSLLLVHGLLHLCGYDHIEDEDAEIMEAREDELLDSWRYERMSSQLA